MVPRALILGGTGAIGRATARRLLAAGWQVDLTGRDPAHMPAGLDARFLTDDGGRQAGDLDLLVDCVCFTAQDAASLLPLAVAAEIDWLVSAAQGGPDAGLLPELDLDYPAQDRWLRIRGRTA